MSIIDSFEKMLAAGKDNPLLRFSLGNEYAKAGRMAQSAVHLRVAVALEPQYSAAWKLLGKALTATNDLAGASDAYRRGIEAAERHGDKQAAKEMMVFLRRLEKSSSG